MNNTLSTTSTFQVLDYVLFSIMVALTAIVGVYVGFCGKKQNSPEEYLYGGKKMKILPIAASLIASDVSGITMLGIPSDVYTYGSSVGWCALCTIVGNIAIVYVYLPVLYNLQITSSFEYLELRFSSRIRTIASTIYTISYILFAPIVIYTAIVAFGQVSQVNLNLLTVIVCIICTAYTTLGGIRAVVWTDTLQMCVMVVAFLIVLCLGVSLETDGFKTVWETGLAGGRVDLNSDFNPTNRTATFTVVIGFTFFYLSCSYNPIFVQRYLSLPTMKHAKISNFILTIGIVFFRTSATFFGLVIYSRYSTCDPISTGSIQKLDQLVPYYITDIASSLPGLSGIFIAGIFCGALSSMSSVLNSVSGIIYEDFIKDRIPADTTDKRASDIMKIIVGALGILSMVLVFVVQHLGGILELFLSVQGALVGPILAMFTLGMLLPVVNEKGIFYGSVGASLLMIWIAAVTKYYAMTGQLVPKKLPASMDGCLISSNITISNYTVPNIYIEDENISEPFYLYRVSFYYYTLMGVIVTAIIALPVSLFTRRNYEIVHKKLLSPVIYKFLSKRNDTIRKQEFKDDKELVHLNQKL